MRSTNWKAGGPAHDDVPSKVLISGCELPRLRAYRRARTVGTVFAMDFKAGADRERRDVDGAAKVD